MKDAIHRLDENQTKLWLISPVLRHAMKAKLLQMYKRDVRVCGATMYWIAYVKTSGDILECPPPHTQYQIWQVSNAPLPSECPCAHFHDPESGAPWIDRGSGRHHPVCQFNPTASTVFQRSQAFLGKERRPDFLTKIEEEEQARRGMNDGRAPIIVGGGRVHDKSRH